MKKNIELTKFKYIIQWPMQLIIPHEKGLFSSVEARRNLRKSRGGTDVMSVLYEGQLIWVSIEEAKKFELEEVEVPREVCLEWKSIWFKPAPKFYWY